MRLLRYKFLVYFSCKITNSVISYLHEQGEDLSFIFDQSSAHEEFLRDPSLWYDARQTENLLQLCLRNISNKNLEDDLFQKIGHSNPDLRCWGVLDSVLKMMPSPHEILSQPERFLSYFISPAPPIESLKRSEQSVEFDLPVSSEEFPLVTSYLKAAFEALPKYVGQDLALCEWTGLHIRYDWSQRQESIFSQIEVGHQISPELLESVQNELQRLQIQLEEKNKELILRERQIEQAEKDLKKQLRHEVIQPTLDLEIAESVSEDAIEFLVQSNSRLNDYMVRAQQLIVMLVGQGRQDRQVQEAMRRVDWEYVKNHFSVIVNECSDVLYKFKENKKQKNAAAEQEKNHV